MIDDGCRNIGLLTPPLTLDNKATGVLNHVSDNDIYHDTYCCMFRISLDSKRTTGTRVPYFHAAHTPQTLTQQMIAALCYLPTRFQNIIEFYHTVSKAVTATIALLLILDD